MASEIPMATVIYKRITKEYWQIFFAFSTASNFQKWRRNETLNLHSDICLNYKFNEFTTLITALGDFLHFLLYILTFLQFLHMMLHFFAYDASSKRFMYCYSHTALYFLCFFCAFFAVFTHRSVTYSEICSWKETSQWPSSLYLLVVLFYTVFPGNGNISVMHLPVV